ncbi:MAG: HAMP domain-containing histidine kinase [Gemmatimonadota bacterium]|nr:HAMP domain-containing histidine kinase [Gemmatimonadota bacterium]
MTEHPSPARVSTRRNGLEPLATLRFRLTAWYVATYAGILLVLGGGLFFVVARQVRRELDTSLAAAVDLLVREGTSTAPNWVQTTSGLRIPSLSLYILDSTGAPLVGDSVSRVVQEAARAAAHGEATRQLPSGAEHVERARAHRFRAADGRTLTAVASADLEDLEDRYTRLISQFSAAAAIALAFVAMGGVFLARKSSAPVESVVAQMREFMADASHELRTPVTVLRTEAEVALARPGGDADSRRALEVIASEAARLSGVVEDLLILAGGDGREVAIERVPAYLDDVVSDVVSAFGTVARQRDVTLTLARFEEAPVYGNVVLLRRLVAALVDNAIKYTPTGGRVGVSVRAEGTSLLVEVADSGIGIDGAALPRVFDRFFRTDRARASAQGTGLGLPIARWIAEAHGGRLTIASSPGDGTVVTLLLPRRD